MAGDRPVKRSVAIAGHATSVTLETAFWDALKDIARSRGLTVPRLIEEIDRARVAQGARAGLSSAIRVWVLEAVASGR